MASVDVQRAPEVRDKLLATCDDVVLLPSRYSGSKLKKIGRRLAGGIYTLRTGLKFSNYLIGRLEFAPNRLAYILEPRDFDCALFEYWHAAESVSIFHRKGIPCVLDMHNVLWQSYARQLNVKPFLPGWWKRWAITQYQQREEQAWKQFDALIAINAAEYEYARAKVAESITVFYAPMGTDLKLWPYSWQPAQPPRIAYYGGLGSPHNQRDALICYEQIMPEIWRDYPDAELWLVGSNPPEHLQALSEKNERVKVTGYVEHVQEVLRKTSVVVCPWSGTYGFRSRLVEVMALGVPVVASPEAVYGMGMEIGRGIFLKETPGKMAGACLALLRDSEFARQQSHFARVQVEQKFSYESTYGQLAQDLLEFTLRKKVCTVELFPPFVHG
jgi:glycosyltransferase involved in cell wall biosynthesis